jgi:hypothetical protein
MELKASPDCPYYFWNGYPSRRAVVGIAERALAAVLEESGVKNADAHRHPGYSAIGGRDV